MPTLSVFMPNYNHAKLLPRAIKAVVKQSRQPDEFIIIDDASTDTSVAIIQEYQKQYSFIRLVQHEKNLGLMHIMKTVLSEIHTDYAMGASADDYILPGFFATAMEMAISQPDAGIIFGQMSVENEGGELMYVGKSSRWSANQFISPERYLHEFLQVEPAMHSLSASTIYKVAALREIGGFREELGPWCDTFSVRAIALRYGASYIARPCAVWTVQTQGVSVTARKKPSHMMNYIHKAARLMLSPEFATYFPKNYVKAWVANYRLSLYGGYVLAKLPVSDGIKKRILSAALPVVRTVGRL